jgi:hypothetical protein
LSIEILTRFLAGTPEYAEAFVEMVPKILAPLVLRLELRKQQKVNSKFYNWNISIFFSGSPGNPRGMLPYACTPHNSNFFLFF